MEQSACPSGRNFDSTMPPVTIDDLPTEMLCEVFSYMTFNDLVNVCRVCSYWKNVGNSVPLMEQYAYTITDKESPIETATIFASIPQLRKLRVKCLHRNNVRPMLELLPQLFTDIRDIDIDISMELDSNLLHDVVKKCTNLKSLSIPLRSNATRLINQIGACSQLRKLVLVLFESDIDLKPIADGCCNLRHLDIRAFVNKYEDCSYLLKRKKDILETFIFNPMGYLWKPALPVSECTHLKHVGYDSTLVKISGLFLDEISSLSGLQRLDLGLCGNVTQDEAIKLSNSSFSSTLRVLNLKIDFRVSEDFTRTIVSGLTNVDKLRVEVISILPENDVLKNLLDMNQLKHLEIVGWSLNEPFFDKLIACQHIKHLIIVKCLGLDDKEALNLVEKMNLLDLKIIECDSLSDEFLKRFPLCETLNTLHVEVNDPLEQTVRELKIRQNSTRVIVDKICNVETDLWE